MRSRRSSRRIRRELVGYAGLAEDLLDFLLTYEKGGALGWKKRGDLDPTFEEKAFELEASTTANPKYAEVKTGFGYHLLMVEGRK